MIIESVLKVAMQTFFCIHTRDPCNRSSLSKSVLEPEGEFGHGEAVRGGADLGNDPALGDSRNYSALRAVGEHDRDNHAYKGIVAQ